jgi:hypothetical protein
MYNSFKDIQDLYNFGRLYVETGNVEELDNAVTYWEIAAHTAERRAVRANFQEGVRNHVDDYIEHDRIMKEFDDRTIYAN